MDNVKEWTFLPMPDLLPPERREGGLRCLMSFPVWTLRAVIFVHFTISSFVLLPTSIALAVFFSFPCLVANFPDRFPPEISSVFLSLRDRLLAWLFFSS